MSEPEHADRLLLIFVHGFHGSDTSFEDFPNRLRTILTNTHKVDVDAVVYPSYKTMGDLSLAVQDLTTWLIDQVNTRQRESKGWGGKGRLMVALFGHSMGGIVSAEVILGLKRRPDDPLEGAFIVGLLAYDTPFYSVNVKYVSSKVTNYADQASRFLQGNSSTTTSVRQIGNTAQAAAKTAQASSSSGWGFLAGVVGIAAIGAAAYVGRELILTGLSKAYDHLEFVNTLIDTEGCEERVNRLVELDDVLFKCFYIQLSSNPDQPRTFIDLPPDETSCYFVPVMSDALSEVTAHTTMFSSTRNASYYLLGADSVSLVSEMIERFHRKHGRSA
ncbi:hypothetical protein CLU79DRAFT_732147 [Phycomyces nitens]|nr:hypothetical protein CLU79DRAFT_732147 [Phycomyces nitens]